MAQPTGLPHILFTESRDFLLDKEGLPVKADSIESKVVGIMIGPHCLPLPLENALSVVDKPYKELQNDKDNKPITFVFVAADRDADLIETLKRYGQTSQLDDRPDGECFNDVLKKLPDGWLAVPFDDAETRSKLAQVYKSGIFSLAFVGPDNRLHSDQGLALLEKWGAEAYPFDDERIAALHKAAQERKENQNLQGLLAHKERDHLISSEDGHQVSSFSFTLHGHVADHGVEPPHICSQIICIVGDLHTLRGVHTHLHNMGCVHAF